MLLKTPLGYYLGILPLLVTATYAFYRKGATISSTPLPVATVESMLLTEVIKRIFQRARPELFDSGYHASGYSALSGHATLALLLAWRLEGFWCWTVGSRRRLHPPYRPESHIFQRPPPTAVLAGFLAVPLYG